MEVNDAIEFIEDSYTYLYVDLHGNKEEVKKFGEIVDLLKSLEAENKKYKNILKELEQARGKRIGKNMSDVIDGFEKQGKKLDLEKRGLILVNMALKEENKAYKRYKKCWESLISTLESFFINTKSEKDFESIILVVRKLIYEHSRKLKEGEE